ncbi:hypothetical protein GCM10010329_77980 [Streptomyces spiroverticillatus]|uniref:Uncharacterized protein n=1 Tax=Streptomyces finlayi TaxID=67296 RepID=A0A918X5B3_9ACTN|nr:hypothetical protein GCM10010329_77980 [Streptomyces spiroverticillatus]GHD13343.1 hypothetical protein GCM10010334_71370 [Streptomyces finlayi]
MGMVIGDGFHAADEDHEAAADLFGRPALEAYGPLRHAAAQGACGEHSSRPRLSALSRPAILRLR